MVLKADNKEKHTVRIYSNWYIVLSKVGGISQILFLACGMLTLIFQPDAFIRSQRSSIFGDDFELKGKIFEEKKASMVYEDERGSSKKSRIVRELEKLENKVIDHNLDISRFFDFQAKFEILDKVLLDEEFEPLYKLISFKKNALEKNKVRMSNDAKLVKENIPLTRIRQFPQKISLKSYLNKQIMEKFRELTNQKTKEKDGNLNKKLKRGRFTSMVPMRARRTTNKQQPLVLRKFSPVKRKMKIPVKF
jgi:hypothetical protein